MINHPSQQISRHVMEANFAVPMLSAYPPTSTATATTTAPMRATKPTAQPSPALITSSFAPTADPTERRSALQSRSSAMERKIAKTEWMRKPPARRLHAQLWDANTSAGRRSPEVSAHAHRVEHFPTTTEPAPTSTSASSGDIAISFAPTPTAHSHVSARLATL